MQKHTPPKRQELSAPVYDEPNEIDEDLRVAAIDSITTLGIRLTELIEDGDIKPVGKNGEGEIYLLGRERNSRYIIYDASAKEAKAMLTTETITVPLKQYGVRKGIRVTYIVRNPKYKVDIPGFYTWVVSYSQLPLISDSSLSPGALSVWVRLLKERKFEIREWVMSDGTVTKKLSVMPKSNPRSNFILTKVGSPYFTSTKQNIEKARSDVSVWDLPTSSMTLKKLRDMLMEMNVHSVTPTIREVHWRFVAIPDLIQKKARAQEKVYSPYKKRALRNSSQGAASPQTDLPIFIRVGQVYHLVAGHFLLDMALRSGSEVVQAEVYEYGRFKWLEKRGLWTVGTKLDKSPKLMFPDMF